MRKREDVSIFDLFFVLMAIFFTTIFVHMIVEETLSLFRSIIVAIILTFLISPYLVGQRQATIQTRRENEKLREELRNIRQKIDEKSQKREKTKDRR